MPKIKLVTKSIVGVEATYLNVDSVIELMEEAHKKFGAYVKLSGLLFFYFDTDDERKWVPLTNLGHEIRKDDIYACTSKGGEHFQIHRHRLTICTDFQSIPFKGSDLLAHLQALPLDMGNLYIKDNPRHYPQSKVRPNSNLIFGDAGFAIFDYPTSPKTKAHGILTEPKKKK